MIVLVVFFILHIPCGTLSEWPLYILEKPGKWIVLVKSTFNKVFFLVKMGMTVIFYQPQGWSTCAAGPGGGAGAGAGVGDV